MGKIIINNKSINMPPQQILNESQKKKEKRGLKFKRFNKSIASIVIK